LERKREDREDKRFLKWILGREDAGVFDEGRVAEKENEE